MRWKSLVGGLALLLATVAGCTRYCFISECDYEHYKDLMPEGLENQPGVTANPLTPRVGKPPTVEDPDRKIRYLSLAEAIAIALEQGTVGQQTAQIPGLPIDGLSFFTRQDISNLDSIRVLALDPAIAGAAIEGSLSKFDAVWTSAMTWQNTDRPIGTALDAFQAASGAINAIEQADANFSTAILKPLPTGGVAGITFRTDYQLTNLPARVNPSYRPSLQFAFEQPLLQGYGVEINQLRASHPGSVLTPGVLNLQPTAEGILISRLRFDQSRAEFERVVTFMLANVEVAYWNLYGAYWNLYAREQALRQGFDAWRVAKTRYEAGAIELADLAQVRGQFELFRGQRIQALADVLERERALRGLLNLAAEDGTRLVPADTPTLARFEPDWDTALEETLTLRPELHLARLQLKSKQLELINQKNFLLPDLRFTATYDINDIGTGLDGPDNNNALRNLASNNFNNWALGLRLNVPIGFRSAHTNVRIARLELARAYFALDEQERKAQRFLEQSYQRIQSTYDQIGAQRAQREAFGEQLRARFVQFQVGKDPKQGRIIDILLEAQRFFADALANEYAAIVAYNNALAVFEFAKGTMLRHDNVVIAEGALPCCAQLRAVEHQEQRTRALVIREHASPVGCLPAADEGTLPVPALPTDKAVSLPALGVDKVGEVPSLPPPTAEEKKAMQPGGPPRILDMPPKPTPVSPLPGGPDLGGSRLPPVPPPAISPTRGGGEVGGSRVSPPVIPATIPAAPPSPAVLRPWPETTKPKPF